MLKFKHFLPVSDLEKRSLASKGYSIKKEWIGLEKAWREYVRSRILLTEISRFKRADDY